MLNKVRRWVQYAREIQVCWKCGVTQRLCEQERGSSSRCRWNYVVVAALCGMREAGRAKQQVGGQRVGYETQLGRSGYIEQARQEGKSSSSNSSRCRGRDSRDSRDKQFGRWIGQVYKKRWVGGQVISNGIGAVIQAILKEEE
jgi:hypothetical protein